MPLTVKSMLCFGCCPSTGNISLSAVPSSTQTWPSTCPSTQEGFILTMSGWVLWGAGCLACPQQENFETDCQCKAKSQDTKYDGHHWYSREKLKTKSCSSRNGAMFSCFLGSPTLSVIATMQVCLQKHKPIEKEAVKVGHHKRNTFSRANCCVLW